MLRTSLEQMLMELRGSGRMTNSSPWTGLLSWTGLVLTWRTRAHQQKLDPPLRFIITLVWSWRGLEKEHTNSTSSSTSRRSSSVW